MRTTSSLDNTGSTSDIHKNGHRDILTTDLTSRFHGVSTQKSAFTSPRGTGVREKGLRAELLKKDLIKSISEQVHAQLTPQPPAPELSSVTKTDYKVKGFRGVRPSPSTDRDYRTDEAITFWKENFEKIQ
ncbi:sperm-associated antigen 8-like, partial [Clarias magur]